jgi:hypothetical protein
MLKMIVKVNVQTFTKGVIIRQSESTISTCDVDDLKLPLEALQDDQRWPQPYPDQMQWFLTGMPRMPPMHMSTVTCPRALAP